uniref:Uncharacterized protein n=1 Tax=Aegilops tauschii subsp. strangulata TaxID=200361 RepID=A0A453PML4_AEGTS
MHATKHTRITHSGSTITPGTQELDQPIHVLARRATCPRRCPGAFLPRRRARSHRLAPLAVHGLAHQPRHLLPRHVATDLHPDAPLGARVPAVGWLLGEEGPADHRHAGAHALQRRVPPAVRQEQPHRRVREDALLRAPARQDSPVLGLPDEPLRKHGLLAGHEVWPDDPQERPAAARQPPRELRELRRGHHRDAAEVDVHHRPGLPLGVQPAEAARVFLPEVPADRVELGLGASRGGFGQRADGVQARERAAERVDDVLLQRVVRVEDEPAGAARVLRLAAVEVEHHVVRVGRSDEAGYVFQTDAFHSGDPVDWSVQVPISQVTLISLSGT